MSTSAVTVTPTTQRATFTGAWGLRETVNLTITNTAGAWAAGTYTIALIDEQDARNTVVAQTVGLVRVGATLTGALDLDTTAGVAAYGTLDRERGYRVFRAYLWLGSPTNVRGIWDVSVFYNGYEP